jgi:hypothetical protein
MPSLKEDERKIISTPSEKTLQLTAARLPSYQYLHALVLYQGFPAPILTSTSSLLLRAEQIAKPVLLPRYRRSAALSGLCWPPAGCRGRVVPGLAGTSPGRALSVAAATATLGVV